MALKADRYKEIQPTHNTDAPVSATTRQGKARQGKGEPGRQAAGTRQMYAVENHPNHQPMIVTHTYKAERAKSCLSCLWTNQSVALQRCGIEQTDGRQAKGTEADTDVICSDVFDVDSVPVVVLEVYVAILVAPVVLVDLGVLGDLTVRLQVARLVRRVLEDDVSLFVLVVSE